MGIGNKIQFERRRRGHSQEALAEQLGVSRQSVSKWELGQVLPELDKVIMLIKLWNLTVDELISDRDVSQDLPQDALRFGLYLIVKDFAKSIAFYEKLLDKPASIIGFNRFAEFRFDGKCWLSIMNEKHLHEHDYTGSGDRKFTLNLWSSDLQKEHTRLKNLNIGDMTDICHPHSNYYFFHIIDPDSNVIEIASGI